MKLGTTLIFIYIALIQLLDRDVLSLKAPWNDLPSHIKIFVLLISLNQSKKCIWNKIILYIGIIV